MAALLHGVQSGNAEQQSEQNKGTSSIHAATNFHVTISVKDLSCLEDNN